MDVKEVVNLKIADLRSFAKHPFKPYGEERLNELAESIKANSVMVPIIVRPFDEGRYEILSGHNRAAAAERAGLEEVPTIIREGLTDDEAMLIVTETNLIQRSFADMSHSEKAATLVARYDAIKHQGKRIQLINDVETWLNPSADAENDACVQLGHKSKSRDKLAEAFGLSANNIARYVKIDGLIDGLKERLDSDDIGFVPAVSLSFLSADEQTTLEEVLTAEGLKVTLKNAEELKDRSSNRKLDYSAIESVLKGNAKKERAPKSRRFGSITKVVDKYFTGGQKTKEIEKTVEKALKFYFENIDMANDMETPEDVGDGGDNEAEIEI